mmetsp:Transcript_47559/g.152810  ORF Transcript_47559/g.152810 Transcript_47559/m.152810 type:complete len:527 (+) Transcript_47559:91-1671(+)
MDGWPTTAAQARGFSADRASRPLMVGLAAAMPSQAAAASWNQGVYRMPAYGEVAGHAVSPLGAIPVPAAHHQLSPPRPYAVPVRVEAPSPVLPIGRASLEHSPGARPPAAEATAQSPRPLRLHAAPQEEAAPTPKQGLRASPPASPAKLVPRPRSPRTEVEGARPPAAEATAQSPRPLHLHAAPQEEAAPTPKQGLRASPPASPAKLVPRPRSPRDEVEGVPQRAAGSVLTAEGGDNDNSFSEDKLEWCPSLGRTSSTTDESSEGWEASMLAGEDMQLMQLLLDPLRDPQTVRMVVESLLFDSMPRENVQYLRTTALHNLRSRSAFLLRLREEGGDVARVRFGWHLAGSQAAAEAMAAGGIRCEEGHCACGRYGLGGYIATCATKANAYADSEGCGGERQLFLVLALPGSRIVRGERGTRPPCTAADSPSHPTEYCFVDGTRLHLVCRLDYQWVPTGRRLKTTTAGGHVRAWRNGAPVSSEHGDSPSRNASQRRSPAAKQGDSPSLNASPPRYASPERFASPQRFR